MFDTISDEEIIGCGSTIKAEGGSRWSALHLERLNLWMRILRWSGGAFILCRHDAFRRIGGFSTGLFAFEEVDFAFRLRREGRKQRKKFVVLHKYPVISSVRKGGNGLSSWLTLFSSSLIATFWFFLYYLLPKKIRVPGNSKLLGYWYKRKESDEKGGEFRS